MLPFWDLTGGLPQTSEQARDKINTTAVRGVGKGIPAVHRKGRGSLAGLAVVSLTVNAHWYEKFHWALNPDSVFPFISFTGTSLSGRTTLLFRLSQSGAAAQGGSTSGLLCVYCRVMKLAQDSTVFEQGLEPELPPHSVEDFITAACRRYALNLVRQIRIQKKLCSFSAAANIRQLLSLMVFEK